MKCPIDETELKMTERQGIEIDYCPKCRGVWLDRGELDKLIERSGPAEPPRAERLHRQEEVRPQYRESGYDQPRYKKA
jgi:Zn-finger nucleic acid-binding protein